MKPEHLPIRIASITDMCKKMGLSKPMHPLISIIKFEDSPKAKLQTSVRHSKGFYAITLKQNCPTKIKYG